MSKLFSAAITQLIVDALKGFAIAFGAVGANAVFATLHWPHL